MSIKTQSERCLCEFAIVYRGLNLEQKILLLVQKSAPQVHIIMWAISYCQVYFTGHHIPDWTSLPQKGCVQQDIVDHGNILGHFNEVTQDQSYPILSPHLITTKADMTAG